MKGLHGLTRGLRRLLPPDFALGRLVTCTDNAWPRIRELRFGNQLDSLPPIKEPGGVLEAHFPFKGTIRDPLSGSVCVN